MMEALADFHFLRPLWLLLAAPALGLWWLEHKRSDSISRWRAVMDPVLLAALTVGSDHRRRLSPADILLAGAVLCAIAAAGPTWRQLPSPFAQAARPAMLVLKATPSMLERDLAPTRLDRAREKIADLLDLREGAPTGLVVYAGSAHLVLPPTPDAAVVTTMAGAVAPDVLPRAGDALADAVALAGHSLAEAGLGGSIVVFADGAPALGAADTGDAPVFLYSTLPPDRATAEPSLKAAATALDATLVVPSIDTRDVAALAKDLETAGPPPPMPGETPRWEEAGWWLTLPIALIALGWFRRGWVLA